MGRDGRSDPSGMLASRRLRLVLVAAVLVVVAGGVVALGGAELTGGGDGLSLRWLSDTGVPVTGNHHVVAAGVVDGRGLVVVPVNGAHGTDQCRLVALDPGDGTESWAHAVPAERCSIHAIADPTLVDHDGDGSLEVLVATSEERLFALGPEGGAPELAQRLDHYGYSGAAVGPLGPAGERRVALVDARGTLTVLAPDGAVDWTRRQGGYVWARPAVVDVTGDGAPEVVVGYGKGFVTAFERDGAVAWNRTLPDGGSVTWMSDGDVDGDGTADVVVATEGGAVHRLDGSDGRVRWSRSFDRLAAVHAMGDGDGDGVVEVYATAGDGTLLSLAGPTGETEWTTALADDPVQMTPPPVMGDLDGDGDPELVGVTSGGLVSVVDPDGGRVLATYERSPPFWAWDAPPTRIWTRATLADTDGDGREEVYVVYGDGRVAALEYSGS